MMVASLIAPIEDFSSIFKMLGAIRARSESDRLNARLSIEDEHWTVTSARAWVDYRLPSRSMNEIRGEAAPRLRKSWLKGLSAQAIGDVPQEVVQQCCLAGWPSLFVALSLVRVSGRPPPQFCRTRR